jgi:RNA 3'-terminal phosphate cyclase (ATP)
VVRALGEIADAEVDGARLGSTALTVAPRGLRPGAYRFDVGAVTGSAGSVSLLFQALLLPLALAGTSSRLTLIGGTHVPWSPPVHYLTDVFLPALATVGIAARLVLRRWGWYPAGGGEVEVVIEPAGAVAGFRPDGRHGLGQVTGLSAVSRLPRTIAERQRERALDRLARAGLDAAIAVEEDGTARGPGTLVFLTAGRAGASALGRRGVPAERVADEAVSALLGTHAAGADVDEHLADQLVPFLALAQEPSSYTCPAVSGHLTTVAWVVEQFLPARVSVEAGSPPRVRIEPS